MSTNNHKHTRVTDALRVSLTHRCASELRSISTPNFSINRYSSTIQFNREDIPVNASEREQVEDKRQPSHPELKLAEVPPAGARYVVRSESALFEYSQSTSHPHLPQLSRSSRAARAQTSCAARLSQSQGCGRHRHCEGVQTSF